MDHITIKEAGIKWGITTRMVNYYCSTGRIKDAVKMGNLWLIPKTAQKPKDGRYKKINKETDSTSLSIERIINDYELYIYNFALKLTCHPTNAEDIAQETFIKSWSHISQLKDASAIKSWLRTTCLNEFRMANRKDKIINIELFDDISELEREGRLLENIKPSPEDEIIVNEEIRNMRDGCFMAMVRKLTLNQRITFSLIDMFGMSINDIAGILCISPAATKGLLYRARMSLESFFNKHCNFIDINNPCNCQAWIEFSQNRNNLQGEMKKLIETLDYRDTNYKYDPIVRRKMLHFYNNMPDKMPSKEWYFKVNQLVKEYYSSKL